LPELPEVETIRRGLEKHLVGKKINELEILDLKLSKENLSHVKSVKVTTVRRFGKGLVIELDNEYSIAVHIKMTGQLIFKQNKQDILPDKHTRAIFKLENAAVLYFNDIRRFGWIKILKTDEVGRLPFFKNLGPEPFKNLTPRYLQEISQKSNLPIKTLIMDQRKISGIGNIYANDALNLAKINPSRKAKFLTEKETNKLYLSILEVLNRGLKYGGSSEVNYVNADGNKGKYQNHSFVYNREGENCLNCGSKIKKTKVSGRGTYFCESCQK